MISSPRLCSAKAFYYCLSICLFSYSVRVSNELGAGRPKAAKFSIVVAVLTSLVVGITFTAVILATKHDFPKLFSDKPVVIKAASKLGYFLAATIFLNSILPVLHGKLQIDLTLNI